MAALSRMKNRAYHERHIGRTVRVLFEKGERDGFSMGLTDNFMRVAAAAEEDPAGTMQDVTITGVADGLAVGRFTSISHSPSLLVTI